MKASKTATSNTIAVLLTIGILVLAWKMVLPGYFSHKANLDTLTEEIDAAKIKLESIEKAKVELISIKPISDQLLVAVPKGADEPDLISELEAIAIKNGIVLPSISITQSETEQAAAPKMTSSAAAPATVSETPATTGAEDVPATDATVPAASATPITIAVSVKGSFQDLSNLIGALEKSVRYMNITSITFGVDSEDVKLNTLALQIEAYQR